MWDSETENTENDEKSSKCMKFHLKKLKEIKELPLEHLHGYVESLHGLIRQHEKKLKKYKDKIRKLLQNRGDSKDVIKTEKPMPSIPSPQAQETGATTEKTETSATEISALDAFNFVDEMRQAAQHAQNISNFIYEPTSGLYYDQKSGYYYNAEYGLYYDGNTGCYYNYNQEKNCYEFHSQVEVQPTSKTTKDTTNDDNSSEKHVNNSLLDRFSNLYIDQMRRNALGHDTEEDDTEEVVFDEHGVVTDREKLKKLRKEKVRDRLEKERKYKKKSSKAKEKEKKEAKHKAHKKRKRSQKQKSRSNSDSDTDKVKKYNHKRDDVEDGEISSSSTSSSSNSSHSDSDEQKRKVPIFKSMGRFQDIAKKYPPSLRIVVQETNLEGLKVGSLSLITFKGGSLGREGNHDVIIPDVNVSKFHLKFTYDTKKGIYKCVDLGSRNGTILNGNRMASSKTESESQNLMHGSTIQIGQTKLLCHIHEGNSTCGLCEPGLLIETQRDAAPGPTVVLSHKEQLKKIQKKYGLENEKFTDGQQNAGSSSYQDRAATRRLKVGSSSDKEKTQIASVNTAISSENKGFKMLSKLGWNKGETLGKSQTSGALLEPINVESNVGTKGLGCDDPTAGLSLTISEKKKIEILQKTKERYQKADIFGVSDDESN